jgi:hypothetical protein
MTMGQKNGLVLDQPTLYMNEANFKVNSQGVSFFDLVGHLGD